MKRKDIPREQLDKEILTCRQCGESKVAKGNFYFMTNTSRKIGKNGEMHVYKAQYYQRVCLPCWQDRYYRKNKGKVLPRASTASLTEIQCRACGVVKPASAFRRLSDTTDQVLASGKIVRYVDNKWRLRTCKECERIATHRWELKRLRTKALMRVAFGLNIRNYGGRNYKKLFHI